MSNVIVRPYRKEDRAQVRALCCDSADRGEPIEGLFPDREVAADLLTAYYTDYEPSSVWIAESEGNVSGYVLGCLDNRRYGLVMNFILLPKTIAKAFKRGVFFEHHVWSLLGGMARNWRRLVSWRKESFHSHQAHLHIGIGKNFRGQQIGTKLVNALTEYAGKTGVGEITASVHSGNDSAGHFFERLGFKVRERYPMVMVKNRILEHYHSLLYVKTLS